MNFFLPQNNQARIELAEIADVKKQIISPSTSGPIIGIIQDGLLGSFIMTQADMKIDWKMAMNMLAYTSIEDKRMKEIVKGRQYTGSEVFSMIIPQRLNCVAPVEIVNGKLIKGIVASSSLGSNKQNNLIHLIWDEYGVNETSQFIADVQRLTNFFNANNGFTIGIGDTVVPQKIHDEIKVLCNTTRLEMHHLLTQFENNPELFDAQTVETEIQSKMAVIRDNSAKLIMDNLSPKNSMIIMLTSGARGAATNIGQIIGILGQNSVEGKRIPKKVNNRSLAYFHQNDDTPDARGFIQRSYVEGVNPVSYIHHMMGAREGLIDTAVKTSESGYIQRKLVKAMEDLHIAYDNTVRTANNSIVQFIYGDTGLDTTKQYVHSISILTLGDTAVINKYKFTPDELKNIEFSDDENERYIPFIIDLRDNVRKSRMKTMIDNRTFDSNFQVPINFRNIIGYILNGPKLGTEMLSPRYIIKRLDDILTYDKTQILCIPKNKYKESIKYKDELTAKYAFRLALHDVLAPKRCIFEYKLDKKKFDSICDRIISTFNKSIVEAGEMVGTIAAQSIGEPTTQMTLNTFHLVGIASASTLGVPRLKELMSVTQNLKTPMMTIYLKDEYKTNNEIASTIASHIKFTVLKDVRKRISVYYDPDPHSKGGFMEKDNVYNVFHSLSTNKNACQSSIDMLPWLLRIEMDREKMLEKNITLIDIKSRFCNNWEKRYSDLKSVGKEEKYLLERILGCAILSNTEGDQVPIIHIRFDMDDISFDIIANFIEVFVDNFKIKGLKSIKNIYNVSSERVISFDNKDHELNESGKQLVIYTAGVNMQDIRYINGIDLNKIVINDIVMIYELYGIEAARAALIREFDTVFTRSNNPVNFHHVELLVDTMTNRGYLTSIDRHGLGRTEIDPLTRASFEKPVDQLVTSAVFSEIDYMRGVSSRIIGGLVINGGTNICKVALDTDLIQKSEFTEDIEQKYRKTFNDVSSDNIIQDIVNKDVNNIFLPF